MTFPASLDRTALWITICIGLLFGLMLAVPLWQWVQGEFGFPLLLAGILGAIYVGTWLFSPQRYGLKNNQLIIYRPISNLEISLEPGSRVQLVPWSKLAGAWRSFGVGGLFGYYGRFRHSQWGGMLWYATSTTGFAVVVHTADGQTLVISPRDPEAFVQQCQHLMSATEATAS